MLTINTRTPAPRRIGGGLDDPQPPAPRSHRGRLPTPGRERRPSPAPLRPAKRTASTRPAKRSDTASPAKQAAAIPTPEAAVPPPVVDASTVRSPIAAHVDLVLDEGQAVADELAVLRAELAALVPAGDSVTTVRLARMVGTKLAGHGAHCALAINPPRGSLTIDEARARCLAALDALRPVERHAVLSLLTADVGEATR